ncbi:MAG: hypothetical protein KDK41_12520 [Leptospiraceae bacterium]|nr:hypothetical protein [Leptospiraceae bacterium]
MYLSPKLFALLNSFYPIIHRLLGFSHTILTSVFFLASITMTQVNLSAQQNDSSSVRKGGIEEEKKEDSETEPANKLSAGGIDRTGQWIFEFERQFTVKKEKPEFEFLWGFNMLQEFHAYNNADLRTIDSSNDFQIRTTDDQQGLALTRAKFDTAFHFPKERVGVELSFGFDGIWGSFQLQGNGNPGTRIARANIFWEFFRNPMLQTDVVLGRQFFSVGGVINDYMLRDVLDAIVFNVHMDNLVDIKVLAVDVYSGANSFGSGENDRWNDEFQYFSRHESGKQAGLNGDVSTYRTGFVAGGLPFMQKLLGSRLDPRVYWFYAQVRGNSGGSDRSENGRIGNFSDNDWAMLTGTRASYRLDDIIPGFSNFTVYADFAMSNGGDVQRLGEPNADWTNFAFGAGAQAQMKGKLAPLAEFDFFNAPGPSYDSNGNMINHGFISMRGDRVGGTLLRRYWGVRPSGYVNYNGIDDTPFDANRKAGVFMIHAAAGVEYDKKYIVKLDYWFLKDNGDSAVNFDPNNLNLINNPYMSRAEIEAQKKLGKVLGQEFNLTLQYFPNSLLMFQDTR